MEAEDGNNWVESAGEVLGKLIKQKGSKWFLHDSGGDGLNFGLQTIQQRLEESMYSVPQDFAKDVRQALSRDVALLGSEEADKINAASEKLLGSFEELWNDDDGQQSENYSGEEDSDSSSDSPSERRAREARPKRMPGRRGRGGFTSSDRPQRRARESAKKVQASASEADDGDLAFDAQQAGKILSRLMRNKNAWPFLEPVDPVALELEDYFEVIKEPMDLGTVKERLSSGHYTSRAEFEREVRLVFSNAIEYNNEGDEIWTAAKALSDHFDSLWAASTVAAGDGANDEEETRMGRAPTVRKPGRRRSALQQPPQMSPRGEAQRNGSPTPTPVEEKIKGKASQRGTSAPRDYSKAVRDGGWRAGALEVMQLLMEHENAWPFMGTGAGDAQSASGRRLDLCGVVERLQEGAYARGGRKDFLRDIRGVLGGAGSDEGDGRRGAMARELAALFETEWTAVARAADAEPPRRPAAAGADGADCDEVRRDEADSGATGDEWRQECTDALQRWGRRQSALMPREGHDDTGAGMSVVDAAAQVLESISTKLEQKIYGTAAEFVGDIRSLLQKAAPQISESSPASKEPAAVVFREIEEELKALESKWSTSTGFGSWASGSLAGPPIAKRELPWRAGAEKVMNKLMNLKDAWPFLEPVDPSIAPDYLEIISSPMDLGTVRENLLNDRYRLPTEWIKDVHLVFDNAEQYNAEEDAVHKLARKVRHSFELASNSFLSSTFPPITQLLAELANEIAQQTGDNVPGWFFECRIILRQILFHPCSWPFLRCPAILDKATSGKRRKHRIPSAQLVELTSIMWLLECGYYLSPGEFLKEIRAVITSVSSDAEPLIKELLPIIEQSTIYIETFRTQRSALTMPARGKKRPILDILSDFQVAEVDWEVDCLVLMDELLQAPNAWPFRAAAIKPDEGAQHGTLDSIKARLISREYPNALEWATDVRRLLSSYLPQKDEKETGGSFPKLNSASTLDKDLGADVEYTDNGEYVALEDETPRSIGQKLSVSADLIVALNKATYSGLGLNAKLHKGTILQLPPRLPAEPAPAPAQPPTDNSKVQIQADSLVSTAATALLASFDARLRGQIASGGRNDGDSTAGTEKGEVVVKFRKAQRFLHTKPDRRMAGICKFLEEVVKDPAAWALVEMTELTEKPGPSAGHHTMSLSIIKAALELGTYATPEEVAADIRLVLETAISLAPAGGRLQQLCRKLLTKLTEGVAEAAAASQQRASASGEGLSLKSAAHMKSVRALLDRMMRRPANSIFLEPVNPEEDGCEDYLDIIQEPVDLGTIKDYLDGGAFETVADFAEHVRLMFKNALTYNPDGSTVHRIATESSQLFEADLAALLSSSTDASKTAGATKERRLGDSTVEEEKDAGGDGMETEQDPQPTVPEELFRELERCKYMPIKWWLGYDEHSPLPNDWEAILDISSQRTYYFHRLTKKVTWEQPTAPQCPPHTATISRRAPSSDGRGPPIEKLKSSDERIPWSRRDGEYFCPILCCWRPIETGSTPAVSRLNDPAAVVTAQRRRALLQPILHQVFASPVQLQRAQPGQAGPVRISVGGTQYQGYMQSNMSAGQVAVFQPGMAQVRANVSAMPAPNSQTLQNMQLQFHQQMNAVLQQQQQQQQQHLHLQQPQNLQHTGQLATQIAQAGAAPWTIQTSSAQHSAYQVPTAADAQLRRIGPGGSLSGQVAAAAAPAVTQAGLFPGSAAALALAAGNRTSLDGRGGL